LSNTLHSSRY